MLRGKFKNDVSDFVACGETLALLSVVCIDADETLAAVFKRKARLVAFKIIALAQDRAGTFDVNFDWDRYRGWRHLFYKLARLHDSREFIHDHPLHL